MDDAAAVKLGARSSLGFGQETVYGTPVAATHFMQFNTEGLVRNEQTLESQAITASEFRQNWGLGALGPEGDVVFELAGVQQALLWKHALGGVVPTEPEPGVNQYVFTPDPAALQALAGLTVQVMRDDIRFVYAGAHVTQLQLSCDVDQIAQLTASLAARGEDTGGTPDTPSFPDPYPLLTFVHGNLKFAGTDIAVNSINAQLDNSLATDRRRLGSRLRRKPQRSGFRQINGSFNADFTNLTLYNAFAQRTPGAEALLELEFVSNLEIDEGFPYSVKLATGIRADGETPTVGSPEEIRQEINWEGGFQVTGAEQGVKVTVVTPTVLP